MTTPRAGAVEPARGMVWSDGMAPMFKGVRTLKLTPNADGSTDFAMREELSGIMLPMIKGSLPDFAPVFEAVAAPVALPHRAQRGDRFSEEPWPKVRRRARRRGERGRLRGAVILKDVLGFSLEEAAETMGTTVMAVKAALVRGRAALVREQPEDASMAASARAELDRYASLFNARDWDGVRALVSDDCRLDLVSRSQRRGKAVGAYFGRYEKENVRLRLVELRASSPSPPTSATRAPLRISCWWRSRTGA